jgi:hypothetical protein
MCHCMADAKTTLQRCGKVSWATEFILSRLYWSQDASVAVEYLPE